MKKFTDLKNIGTVWNNIDDKFIRKNSDQLVVPKLEFSIDSQNITESTSINITEIKFNEFKEFVDSPSAYKFISDMTSKYLVFSIYRYNDNVDLEEEGLKDITNSILLLGDNGIYEMHGVIYLNSEGGFGSVQLLLSPYIQEITDEYINNLK